MSIATKRGDTGQTGLAGGIRTSKADLRVEAYGTVDELNTALGFARSLCTDAEIKAYTESIQRTLFRLGSALATPPNGKKQPPVIGDEDILRLEAILTELPPLPPEPNLPGADRVSAAYNMARTLCLRAERNTVRFLDADATHRQITQPNILIYLNRLSEVLAGLTEALSRQTLAT